MYGCGVVMWRSSGFDSLVILSSNYLLLKVYVTFFNGGANCYNQCINDYWRVVISMLLYIVM